MRDLYNNRYAVPILRSRQFQALFIIAQLVLTVQFLQKVHEKYRQRVLCKIAILTYFHRLTWTLLLYCVCSGPEA